CLSFATFVFEHRGERRQLLEGFALELDDVTGAVQHRFARARREGNAHGLAEPEREGARFEHHLLALLGAAREQADAAPRLARLFIDDEIEAACRASTDAHAHAAA